MFSEIVISLFPSMAIIYTSGSYQNKSIVTRYQQGVYYSGIKIFNGLPKAIKDISSKSKKFKITLKHYLLPHAFYSLGKFFSKR